MYTKYQISLDLMHFNESKKTRTEQIPRIFMVQGDKGTRLVEITLTAGGEPWSGNTVESAFVRYLKPDGSGGSYDTLPNGEKAWNQQGNVISFEIAPQVLSVPGLVEAQLEMQKGNQCIATFIFQIMVERDPSYGAVTSENYINWKQWLEAELDNRLQEAKESGDFTGSTPNLQIGTVTSLPSNSEATASIGGTVENPLLNLGIPRCADDALHTIGGTMSGPINMNGYAVTGLTDPTTDSDAISFGYAKGAFVGAGLVSKIYFVNTDAQIDAALVDMFNTMNAGSAAYFLIAVETAGLRLSGGNWLIEAYSLTGNAGHVVAKGMVGEVHRFRSEEGAFGEWRWHNPPLEMGVEYCTTNNYYGKPVYTQLVTFGTLPATSLKTVEHGIVGITQIVNGSAHGSNGGLLGVSDGISYLIFDKSMIRILTCADLSWMSANIVLQYTKN